MSTDHEDVLRCLRYMHDVESHTVCSLRDLLVTSANRDPQVTAFLTMWNMEEHWHGDAIATFSPPMASRPSARGWHPCDTDPRARWMTRRALQPLWQPVGATVMPIAEVEHSTSATR